MLNTGSRTAATSAIMADSGIGGSGSRARRRTHARGEVCQNPLRPVYGNAMLGQFLEFSFAAQPLAKAFEVYRSLGYRPIDVGDQLRDPYVALSDGTVTVGLHEREQPGPRLTFVRPRLRDYVRGVRRIGIEIEHAHLADDEFNEVVFSDPSGQSVALLEARTFAPVEWEGRHVTACGEFLEYSVATDSVER